MVIFYLLYQDNFIPVYFYVRLDRFLVYYYYLYLDKNILIRLNAAHDLDTIAYCTSTLYIILLLYGTGVGSTWSINC